MADKITSFEDLTCWKDSIELAATVYEFTKNFPSQEQFGITNQIRRASASISANIAEGFGRQSQKEKIQFYSIAYGSLLEVKSFIYLAEKLGYLEQSDLHIPKITNLQKQLNALMRAIKLNA